MKEKLFDNPVTEFHSSDEWGSRTQRLYHFSNGYGASVVRNKLPSSMGAIRLSRQGSYTSYTRNEKEWELGVIKFHKAKDHTEWGLDYTTPITNSVIGYLREPGVEKVLQRIKRLRRRK